MTEILLADIGGTHARLATGARDGHYTDFKKYRLTDFSAFSHIIDLYMREAGRTFSFARFSMARTPVNRVINYKRFAGDPDYAIDFNALEQEFRWHSLEIFNDLEAAAMGLSFLSARDADLVVAPHGEQENEGRTLISVGTGAGHAFANQSGILRTHGGHFAPPLITDEQKKLADFILRKKGADKWLIIEDFVSSRGLVMCAEFITGAQYDDAFSPALKEALSTHPDITRLFFECLGLHAHVLCSVSGFYGGIYLTGGVMDHLVDNGFVNWSAFSNFFKGEMVSVVEKSLISTPVYYVRERELPLLGLSSVEAV